MNVAILTATVAILKMEVQESLITFRICHSRRIQPEDETDHLHLLQVPNPRRVPCQSGQVRGALAGAALLGGGGGGCFWWKDEKSTFSD